MGEYDPESQYFVYEADEFDRNFLSFKPYLSLITGIDWDHPDIYPTKEDYDQAFMQFLEQSDSALVWKADATHLGFKSGNRRWVLDQSDTAIDQQLSLPGHVNRLDAWQVAQAVQCLTSKPLDELLEHMNNFPGVARRFEQLVPGLYSDYAHTPPKVRGALQLAHEQAGDNVVVIYEGLHNTRQHFIKEELRTLFDGVKQLYIVPSYLAREDASLALLSPSDLKALLSKKSQSHTQPSELNKQLKQAIEHHVKAGDTVVAFSAGGGSSLDEWLRKNFSK